MNNQQKFNQIVRDIQSIKIQGARDIAKSALYAYSLFPSENSKKILLHLRPTEPMLHRAIEEFEKTRNYKKILSHFDSVQEKINKDVFKIIKNQDKIFTHCHSTNVVNALIYSKKHRRKFEIYNTETRPLFQGRKTATELKKARIKVTMFIDSAIGIAIEKENSKDKIYANKIFLGADAILKNGIINKIGSGLIAEIAFNHNVPVYIVADSWKFSKSKIPLEQRNLNEVWDKAPLNIKIKNPAFEFVQKKYIKAIVSEFGVLKYEDFLKKVDGK